MPAAFAMSGTLEEPCEMQVNSPNSTAALSAADCL